MHNRGGVKIVHKQYFHMGTCIEGGDISKLGAPLLQFFTIELMQCVRYQLVAKDEQSWCQNDAFFLSGGVLRRNLVL